MKKSFRKALGLLCCLIMTLSMSLTAFAAAPDVTGLTPDKTWELTDTAGNITAKYYATKSAIIIQAKDNNSVYNVEGDLLDTMKDYLRTNNISNLNVYMYSNVQLPKDAFGGSGSYGATFLSSFEILPAGDKKITIPEDCFYNCDFITSFKGFDYVSSVGPNAFRNTDNMNWPEGVLDLSSSSISMFGEASFNSCGNVKTLKLPTSVDVTLSNGCFMNNFDLTHVYNMYSVKSIGKQIFDYIGAHTIYIERDPVNKELIPDVLNYDWAEDDVTVRYSQYKYKWNLIKADTVETATTYPLDNVAPAYPNTTVETTNMGVYSDNTLSTVFDMSKPADKDMELWVKMTTMHKVTYDTKGGSLINAIQVMPGSKLTRPVNPSKTDCTFNGWFKDAAYTTPWDFDNDVVNADVTLHAKWTYLGTTLYTVVFDTQGGSTIDSVSVSPDSYLTKPADPTKDGYNFGGWYKESECKNAWDFTKDIVNSNVTLYAKWIAKTGGVTPLPNPTGNTFKVTFKSNGGSKVDTLEVTENSLIPKPADPTKAGHTFGGWYKEGALTNLWNFDTEVVTADLTLYAKWLPKEFTVKFNLNGGDGDIDNQFVLYGGYVEEPEEPERDDYEFDGWYTSKDFSTEWNFDSNKVTKNTTLYAKWLSNEVTVNFNSQGGTAVESQTIARGSSITEPSAPTRDNYIFGGWYKEAECKTAYSFGAKVNEDMTLYAKWTTTQVTVTFNTQGGPTLASVQVAPGSTIAVPAVPVRSGYTFLGWYKDAACTTAWNFATDVVNENTTLYAKWLVGNVTLPQTGDTTPLALPLGLALLGAVVGGICFKRSFKKC